MPSWPLFRAIQEGDGDRAWRDQHPQFPAGDDFQWELSTYRTTVQGVGVDLTRQRVMQHLSMLIVQFFPISPELGSPDARASPGAPTRPAAMKERHPRVPSEKHDNQGSFPGTNTNGFWASLSPQPFLLQSPELVSDPTGSLEVWSHLGSLRAGGAARMWASCGSNCPQPQFPFMCGCKQAEPLQAKVPASFSLSSIDAASTYLVLPR